MADKQPTLEEWRRLYELIEGVKALGPWEWMNETDLFGVQNPESGDQGFVSVMGNLGEHYGVSLYLGAEGLYGFWAFQALGEAGDMEGFFQLRHLQASLEDREILDKRDRDIIKQLGLKYRGRQSWPMFRIYEPALFPWYLNAAQTRFLACALEQLLDVAPRYRAKPKLFPVPNERAERYLVRVPKREGEGWSWLDKVKVIKPPGTKRLYIPMDAQLLAAVKKLPQRKNHIEADCFMLQSPIRDGGERPFFPYMLMIVDGQSGMILGGELLQPLPTMEAMWEAVPMTMLTRLAATGFRPSRIVVRSSPLQQLLERLTAELGIQLERVVVLPMLDEARASLEEYMGGEA